MVLYCCPRCNYTTKQRGDIRKHFNRKQPCNIVNRHITIEECLVEVLDHKLTKTLKLTPIDPELTPIDPEMTPIDSEMTPIDPEMTPIDPGKHIIKQFKKKEEEKVRKFTCEYCDQELSKNCHLHRHYGRCKVKKKLVEAEKIKHQMENEIDRLIKEKSELHVRLSEAISKVGNNNNNNNIVLLNFGNERIDHLDIGRIKHLIEEKGPFGALPQIFSEIYLNNDVPENMTIRYPNRKYPKLEYHKDGKWITGDKKLIIDKTTMKTFEVCKKAKSNKIEQVKQDYMNNVFTTRKRIYNDMENQLLTFKVNY
jgi:hypothetical protein